MVLRDLKKKKETLLIKALSTKGPLERCIGFSSNTTGLAYRNNMFVTSKCFELELTMVS